MFSFRTSPIEEQLDRALISGRVACFCTPNCWDVRKERYLYEIFQKRGNLVRIIGPSEGELRGNFHIDFDISDIEDLDAIVVEIQDVGTRYFGYTRDVMRLMSMCARMSSAPAIYIVDHPNPASRAVEGTVPEAEAESQAWTPKVPHRHGLTLGELCLCYYGEIAAKFPLHLISAKCSATGRELMPWVIAPAADIPGIFSCELYPGGALWNETTICPGLGTSRPYEYFGAPFIKTEDVRFLPTLRGVMMRPCSFIPSEGIYKGELCHGYHIMLSPEAQYHSLLHTLMLMRHFAHRYSQFEMKDSLHAKLGDPVLSEYIKGEIEIDALNEHIKTEEQKWIRKAKRFLLYEEAPYRRK